MFQYLIAVKPLGFLYGSAGAFLSAENLVGKSGAKFPPDASVMSGLILRTYQEHSLEGVDTIKKDLTVAGAFWAKDDDLEGLYVPIPRSHIFGERIVDKKSNEKKDDYNQWTMTSTGWEPCKDENDKEKEVSSGYKWQKITFWNSDLSNTLKKGLAKETPWTFNPFLHPQLEANQRHVLQEDGLFLENAVQMREDTCLVYLSTHKIPDGWYRFGGEGHLVEIRSENIDPEGKIYDLLTTKISKSFALICPALWGTNNLSTRYPTEFKSNGKCPQMLTDRPVPFRYRLGKGDRKFSSVLGVGRYAVPAGTVYVLKKELNKTWWEFDNKWFPQNDRVKLPDGQHTLLKQLGCGLCLPITVKGVEERSES